MSTTRSKHAFGSEANVDAALAQGLIDAYDILFLDEKKIGWIDRNGNKVIVENADPEVLETLRAEVADKVGMAELDEKIEKAVQESVETTNAYVDEKVETVVESAVESAVEAAIEDKVDKSYEKSMYEISHKPAGTIVDYRDKEIRVMCPVDTKWVKQEVGTNGNANMYYMGFKAYAPDDAVSFKEDDQAVIEDSTMYYFENNDFAGVDENGRKYSIVWLALASYDETSDTWTYFGAKSTTDKYVGWYYSVEWYNADGMMIASDCIRINLSNEDCHAIIRPFYMSEVLTSANAYADAQIEAKIAESSAFEVVEF